MYRQTAITVITLILLAVAGALAQTGSIEVHSVLSQAKSAALHIKSDFQRGQALDPIGAAEATTGDLESAARVAQRAYPNDMATLTAIGEQLAKSGDLTGAQRIGAELPGGSSSTIFAFMAKGEADRNQIGEALKTSQQIKAPEVRSYALTEIAQRQAANGDYAAARKTLALANSTYPAQQSSAADIESTIAEAQIKRGEISPARGTLAVLAADDRSAAMISIAQELLEAGNTAEARDWLKEALDHLPEEAGSVFLRYWAIPVGVKLGLKDRALQAAASMGVKGYSAVAISCAETSDFGCMSVALSKMQSAALEPGEDAGTLQFDKRLQSLNIAAALIDAGGLDEADRLLDSAERNLDDMAKITIHPEAQLERVVVLAQRQKYSEARSLALTIDTRSAGDERETALRISTALEAKQNGPTSVYQWAVALPDAEDRAYALLGIAQTLLGIANTRLPYTAIQIH